MPIIPLRARLVWLLRDSQSVFKFSGQRGQNIRKRTSKVIGGNLVGWVQRIGDQVLGPLVKELVVVLEEGGVVGSQVVLERHDKHVTTFLQWHLFIGTVGVTGSVGVVGTEIVHRPTVGVLASLLVDEERFEQHLHPDWVGVNKGRVSREDNVDGLDVAVRRDFLKEDVLGVVGANELNAAECLTESQSSNSSVVITDGRGIRLYLGVKLGGGSAGILVITLGEDNGRDFIRKVLGPQRRKGLDTVGAEELNGILLGETDSEDTGG